MNVSKTAQERVELILYGDGMGLAPKPNDNVFRIEIQGGGCTGFKYNFDITDVEENDIYISDKVVVDPFSMTYLEGSTLDFKNDVFSQSFVIDNPNVKTTCGCGESIGF
jgi:iron-sulfur cluster assembly accessory protein